MANLKESKYLNRALASSLFFLISIGLVIWAIVCFFITQHKWEHHFVIIQKQSATVESIQTLFDIQRKSRHDLELERLKYNYDLYIDVLAVKKSLIAGNRNIQVAKTENIKFQETLGATSDTWEVVKSILQDQKNGLVVSNKDFNDNIQDLRDFHASMNNRIKELSKDAFILGFSLIIGSIVIFILSTILLFLQNKKSIYLPLQSLKQKLALLASGNIIEESKANNGLIHDSHTSTSIINNFNTEASKALMEYGYGNFDYKFKRRSSKDKLGRAIEQMKFRIKDILDEDRKKSAINNRINQGMAKFSDVLQRNSHDVKILIDTFVTELITYFEANQGALYTLNETQEKNEDQELELRFTYAWNRTKFKSDTFKVGDNLAGQAVLENDTIYMTNVPEKYIEITSGIGQANPTSLLIVPLKLNEQPKGVLEIASFKEFEKYEIELIEKLCENFASTITNTLANEKTRQLLGDARKMTSAMKEQEDQMRRNQEEMQMEQENSQREISRLEAQLEEVKHQKERLEQDLNQLQN